MDTSQPEPRKAASRDEEPQTLVVIGSSAGGIESLSRLVAELPADFPAPIILAQHLHPERESRLLEILQARSKLPIVPIDDQHDLANGTIYLVVPNTHIAITDHDVQTVRDGPRPMPSIDLLFETAADIFKENVIAVILSGTGSDGSAGARAIKEANGLVIIENPQTSAFPEMALAVQPTLVDFIVDLDAIGELLHDLSSGVYVVEAPSEHDGLEKLLVNIQERTGIDFSSYKTPTIMRRIQRRMVATETHNLDQYLEYLDANPDEYSTLAASFLIKVTEFFRDRELFDHLLNGGLDTLINYAAETGELRIWSAGCATGEEAYSLALVVREVIGNSHPALTVRIFATDIDAEAITFARRGIYPKSATKNLPPEYLERYFDDLGDFYEVRRSLRSIVVFGEHDLGQRSPFPRIDVVVCRNVLIYFATQLQRRTLQIFAFALREGGLLILGKAETVSPLPDFFTVQDARLKIYQRQGNSVLIPPSYSEATQIPARVHVRPLETFRRSSAAPNEQDAAIRRRVNSHAERILRTLPIGTTVVDRNYRISYINNAARQHLGIHGVAIDEDLIHVVQNVPLTELRNSIEQALRGETDPGIFEIESATGRGDARHYIEYRCSPIADETNSGEILIQTIDITNSRDVQEELRETSARLQRQITAYQNLEATNRRLAEVNNRLHSNNEDLLISNEEFQAAAEEVETLNEELQATNEELETLNEELQATIEELNTTNEDLQIRGRELELLAAEREEQQRSSEARQRQIQATLASIDDAVLLVSADSEILVSNPTFDEWFAADGIRLLPDDVEGNRLPAAEWPQNRAAAGESFTMRFSALDRKRQRRLFEARGRPIQGDAEHGGGVVVIRKLESA